MTADWNAETIGWRRIWAMILLPLCLFIGLAVFSYDWQDISLLRAPPNDPPANLIGPAGAWLSFLLYMLLGVGATLAPVWCLAFSVILFVEREPRVWPRAVWLTVLWLAVTGLIELEAAAWAARCQALNITDAGGLFGRLVVSGLLARWLSPVGAGILVWSVLAVALVLLVELRNWLALGRATARAAAAGWTRLETAWAERRDRRSEIDREQRELERRRKRLMRVVERNQPEETDETPAPAPAPAAAPQRPAPPEADAGEKEQPAAAPARAPRRRPPAPVPAADTPDNMPDNAPVEDDGYALPGLDLLDPLPAGSGEAVQVDTATTGAIIRETLAEFGIEVEVTHFEKGPVVTRYELLPAPGVRVERISGLSNNLALALKATSVRVQAPIPGKGVVGVEVPNDVAKKVTLREVIEGRTWRSGKARVPLALGKDVGGNDLVIDLADMPHLLVAGATGAGKTVCMNTILTGLLMAMKPSELRLLLVDPKIVEFATYNHLPHLVVPVITDPHKVTLGLRWAINEMERRYKLFASVGVRNIVGYNSREVAHQEELFGGLPEAGDGARQEKPARLPYIVIVIDELADLMLAAQADIENAIARLAQLSRAVGIHMIISTQRPSVNVITGTIKANFPARIAFQVAQKVDSRTILDTTGADKLLGKGDMLYLPPGSSKLTRAQGAMTTDAEIHRVVDFIKQQGDPTYDVEIHEKIERASATSADTGDESDELIEQAVQVIRETRRASTSSLQRRLRIGYTRAARIMDILEERGIIGPPRGSDPREILIDLDGDIPQTADEDETI